jgi:hypothetical protein
MPLLRSCSQFSGGLLYRSCSYGASAGTVIIKLPQTETKNRARPGKLWALEMSKLQTRRFVPGYFRNVPTDTRRSPTSPSGTGRFFLNAKAPLRTVLLASEPFLVIGPP